MDADNRFRSFAAWRRRGRCSLVFSSGSGRGSQRSKAKPPVFVSLETFTVNLQPEHSEQHLQTNLTLKVEDSRTVEEIKLHMPEVRNRILLLLSSKTASQLMTVEGKRKLAAGTGGRDKPAVCLARCRTRSGKRAFYFICDPVRACRMTLCSRKRWMYCSREWRDPRA